MRLHPRSAAYLIVLLAGILGCAAEETDSSYIAETNAWHAKRLETLCSETGWLTWVGLHPLREGVNTLGSGADMDVQLIEKAPPRMGTLTITGNVVTIQVEEGIDVRVEGDSDKGAINSCRLRTDAEPPCTVLSLGSLLFHVIQRGDKLLLRVGDRQSEARRNFKGVDRFPVDPRWRIEARLQAYDSKHTIAVPNAIGQTNQRECPGILVFELNGKEHRLFPIVSPGKSLLVVFGDRTSGTSTHVGGRYLSARPPDSKGKVVLDFNRAINPACAFTPYATCDLPPEGNTLPIAVQAGEKAWGPLH